MEHLTWSKNNLTVTYMKRIYILPILYLLLCTACEKEDQHRPNVAIGDEITFTGRVVAETVSRADGDIKYETLPDENITIIAPGYGSSSAENQNAKYKAETGGSLTPIDVNKIIKRSAMNMMFAAWTTPGVNVEEGTVDFNKNLDNLIGAHFNENKDDDEEAEEEIADKIALEFKHLVAKLTIEVFEIKEEEEGENKGETATTKIKNASITFPAIKEMGQFITKLTDSPSIVPGVSGSELKKDPDAEGNIQAFLPPLSADDLMMYGTFSIRWGETDYVGTLNNLKSEELKDLKAGDHIKMEIKIQDDHTALLQAVTLAPWDAYPDNFYNRPSPGIWGMEDLQNLSALINADIEEVNGFKLDDFYVEKNGQKIIRQYTDITFDKKAEFSPIGTESRPFEGMVFDGNGYHINKLNLDYPSKDNQGLFGVVKDAIIQNVSLKNFLVEGKNNVGALVGQSLGGLVVDHCFTSDGTVSGIDNIGGLIGVNHASDIIRNCSVRLRSVAGSNQVGGFIGVNNGKVGNSFTILSQGLSCAYENAGGFAGRNNQRIENCYSSVIFSSTPQKNCGAFVGYDDGYIAINATGTYLCYWSSNSIDNGTCSKIIGNNERTDPKDNLEILPKDTGEAFNSSGNITNLINTTVALRERLNRNVVSISNTEYLKWATVKSYPLPVFSYKSELNE